VDSRGNPAFHLLPLPWTVLTPPEEDATMDEKKVDKTKVDPLTGAEEKEPAQPLQTKTPGKKADATSVVIPGTGEIVKDVSGQEAKRVVRT